MNLELEIEFSKAALLQEVDALKKQIDDMRPLPEDVEGRIMQKLRLDWNYHSNAIEGNRLSYGETVAFLMEGITAQGKPLKDHLDIRGHNEAINFLLSIVKDTRPISEADIRALHKMILVEPYDVKAQTTDGLPTTKRIKLGEYKILSNHVKTATGETHYYATPEETPAKMQELIEWYYLASADKEIHPVVVAALFHHKFVAIHPFDDGNGRLSRILMNLILMRNNYPPAIIKKDDKQNYYALLSQADSKDSFPFIGYIGGRLLNSMNLYLKAANGGEIDEDEDIGKEIALLRMQLTGGIVAVEKSSQEAIERVFFNSLLPLALKIVEKSKNFHDFFFSNNIWFTFQYNENGRIKKIALGIVNNNDASYNDLLGKDGLIIDLNAHFQEYKDPNNIFTLSIVLTMTFEVFYYKILLNKELIMSKLYHEKLSSEDHNKVIRYFIQDFKRQLNEKTKSPKS